MLTSLTLWIAGWVGTFRDDGTFVTRSGFAPDLTGIGPDTVVVGKRSMSSVTESNRVRTIGDAMAAGSFERMAAALPLWSDASEKRPGQYVAMTLEVALAHPVYGSNLHGLTIDKIVDAYTEAETVAA